MTESSKGDTEWKTTRYLCEQRIDETMLGRLTDLTNFNTGNYDASEVGEPHEYGLSLDFVQAGTFHDQPHGYVRFQFSWGGPSDEIRIKGDGSMTFWFLDWGDSAKRPLNSAQCLMVAEFLNMTEYNSLHAWAQDSFPDFSDKWIDYDYLSLRPEVSKNDE